MTSLLKDGQKVVKWGIVGAGAVCEVKSGPGFYKSENSKLVAVCRRDEVKGRDFAKRHNVPKYYNKFDDMLEDEDINAMYISTPPSTHYELAIKCAEKKLPTYVEKPVARSYTETLAIVNAFQRHNTPLFVAYYRRGQKKFIQARRMIKNGDIGEITSVSYVMLRPQKPMFTSGEVSKVKNNLPWRYRAKESGGGLIMDVGCHTIDIIDFMCGEIFNVSGTAKRIENCSRKESVGGPYYYDVEDQVSLTGNFRNGALLSCLWSFNGTPGVYDDTIKIRGTKGEIEVSTFQPTPLKVVTIAENEDAPVLREIDLPPPEHAQLPLIQSICNCLVGKTGVADVTNISTGDNALRCALVIDKALESYYGNRSVDYWNYPEQWPGLKLRADEAAAPRSRTSWPIRQAFVMTVDEGQREEYERRHRPIWPELETVLKDHGVITYSIYYLKSTNQLFAYAEIEDLEKWNAVAKTDICQKWWAFMGDIMPSNADNSPVSESLEEVFHIEKP